MNTLGLGRHVNTFGLGALYGEEAVSFETGGPGDSVNIYDMVAKDDQDVLEILTMIGNCDELF